MIIWRIWIILRILWRTFQLIAAFPARQSAKLKCDVQNQKHTHMIDWLINWLMCSFVVVVVVEVVVVVVAVDMCCWCFWDESLDIHDATKCNTQNKTENNIRNILKNLTRIFSSSSCVLCSCCSSSLMDTLLSGWRWASSKAWNIMEWNIIKAIDNRLPSRVLDSEMLANTERIHAWKSKKYCSVNNFYANNQIVLKISTTV